jgi:arylformamidase
MPTSGELLKLSYDLSIHGPLPHTIPPVKIEPYYRVEKDGANVFVITFANHSGTHVDAPRHVAPHGLPLTGFALEEFIFDRPVCIDLRLEDESLVFPEHLEPFSARLGDGDVLLIRTGFGRYRSSDPERYRFRAPGFSIRAAEYIRNTFPGIRCIAMDTISFACIAQLEEGMEAHRVLLCPADSRFLLVEDLNLEVDLSCICSLELHPWLIDGIDSAPCTVIAKF